MAGAKKVHQVPLAGATRDSVIAPPENRLPINIFERVVHLGQGVVLAPRRKPFPGGAAGIRHWREQVGVIDGAVALRA